MTELSEQSHTASDTKEIIQRGQITFGSKCCPMIRYANLTLMVSDFDRSVRFYTETLGLKLKSRYENEWAEVEAPGLTIGLHPARKPTPDPGRSESLSVGLGVDNLETAMTELKDKGVVFSPDIIEDGPLRIVYFTDPDKNPLYLCQYSEGAYK